MKSQPTTVPLWKTIVLGVCAMQVGPSLSLAAGYQLHLSGRHSWFVIAVAAVISLLVAAAIAFFARRIVATGSVLSYVQAALPHWAISLTGASLLLGYIIGPASNVMGSAMYFSSILQLLGVPGAATPFAVSLIVVFVAVFAGWCAFRGIELSAKVAVVLGLSCIPVAIGITVAAAFGNGFDLSDDFSLRELSWIDLGRGVFVAFGFLVGFDGVTSVANETADPKRNVSRVLYWSLCVTGVVVALGAMLQTPILIHHVADIDAGETPTTILSRAGGISGINLAADMLLCLAVLAGLIGWLNFAAIIVATAARDGFLPRALGALHPQRRTPYRAIVFLTVVSILICVILHTVARTPPIVSMLYITNAIVLMWLIPYVLVCWAVIVYQRRHGGRIGLAGVTSALAIVALGATLAIHVIWSPDAVARTTDWLTFGLILLAFAVLFAAGPGRQISLASE